VNAQQINLNGGAITPYCAHRTDIEKHSTSLLECHNFIPMPYGGVRKRPGTEYKWTLTNVTDNSRLHFFQGSDGKRYILIFSPTHFQAWDIAEGDDTSIDGTDAIHTQTLAWPMTDATMADLRIYAVNDVLYLCSPHFHPLQLSYFNATTWTIAAIKWSFIPMLDENLDDALKITVLSDPVATTWATATTYAAGVTRLSTDGTREYECIQSHTSGASTSPGVGVSWDSVWKPKVYPTGAAVTLRTLQGVTTWATATAYAVNAYVLYSGSYYVCLVAHNSTSGAPDSAFGSTLWRQIPEIFSSLHPGTDPAFSPAAQFQVQQKRSDAELSSTIKAIAANDLKGSPPVLIDGAWDFQTFGLWDGTFTIQRSYDNGTTWETVRTFTGSRDNNVASAGEEETAVLMRIYFEKDGATVSGGNQRATLTPRNGYVGGRVAINTYASATQMTASTLETIQSGTTWKWTESAFSRRRGYPAAITLHDRRLTFASTTSNPTGLWFSEVENFLNFEPGTEDADAFFIVLATGVANKIQWLASQRRLFIGCKYSEWVVGSETTDTVVTPTSFRAREYTTFGSANREALRIGDAVVFAQRNDNRLREMAYDASRENYNAADLTRLAEHFFLNPATSFAIRSMSWQESREPMLWITRNDGSLLTFTYARPENIAAWASHSTQAGQFLSVCVAPALEDDDEIFFLTQRTGPSGNVYCLEKINSNAHKLSEFKTAPTTYDGYISTWAPAVYDCTARNTEGFPYVSTTIPSHPAVADAHVRARRCASNNVEGTDYAIGTAVSSGIGVPPTGTALPGDFLRGIPIISYLQSMPLEMPSQTGSSIGRKKRMHKIRAHIRTGALLQACTRIKDNVFANTTLAHWELQPMTPGQGTIFFNLTDQYSEQKYSGWVEQNTQITGQNIQIGLYHSAPEVCTITALVAEFEVYQS
jgi:hypothetical protein